MRKGPTPLQLHEAAIQRAPDRYAVALFKGSGQYMKAEVGTFDRALAIAKEFYDSQHPGKARRPAAIYAVKGHHQSHVLNYSGREIKMTYLLTWKGGDHQGMRIERYVDMATAKKALDSIEDPAVGGVEVDDEMHLDYPNPTLVGMFNALAGPDDPRVNGRFSTKGDGQRRLFARIELLAKDLPILGAPVSEQENDDMAGKTKKAKAPKGAKRTRVSKDAKITLLAEENPKRKGTAAHAAFALYRSGMLVSTFLEKGGRSADLSWDVKHGHIKVG